MEIRAGRGFAKTSLIATIIGFSTVAIAAPTAQFVSGVTVTSVGSTDFGSSEFTFLTVSSPVVAGCTHSDYYMIRDPVGINPYLAIATSALVAGRTIDIYVAGTCDSATGEPIISQIVMH